MLSVYQHWDPLEVCVLGRSYPPEFYSHITNFKARLLLEKIAFETEEDYIAIQKKLEEFGVTVLRPDLPDGTLHNGRFLRPPMTPRDVMTMIGTKFYESVYNEKNKYNLYSGPNCYDKILDYVEQQGNETRTNWRPELINGAQVIRLGKDVYYGTDRADVDIEEYQKDLDQEFPDTRNHVVNTGGHYDGTCCVVAPGLIVSAYDAPTYEKTFPGWEVVYLHNMAFDSRSNSNAFLTPMKIAKAKHRWKWWVPGLHIDDETTRYIDSYLSHWLGYAAETVFDLNMLIVDPKNVLVYNENEKVFRALERYGITPHMVPFRHRFFWDGGLHCITSDLSRKGTMQNFFKDR